MKFRKIIFGFSIFVLLSAVSLQCYQGIFYKPRATVTEKLAVSIPWEIPGWICEDEDANQSEEYQEAVDKYLNFDDSILRNYTKGTTQVKLYIAYWLPMKMTVRLVSIHTPDVCWTRAGWKCSEKASAITPQVGDTALKPAEFRVFQINDAPQYVYFWHMVAGRVHIADNDMGNWSPWNSLTTLRKYGLNQRNEQMFIRISSNEPFKNFWNDPGFQKLMAGVAETASLFPETAPAQTE